MFVLVHTNYARWLPVHVRDMKTLPREIRDVFKKYWVFTKTKRKSSSKPVDHAHEHIKTKRKSSSKPVDHSHEHIKTKRKSSSKPVDHAHEHIKTKRKSSSKPVDHAHEHINDTVKGSGGAIGLKEHPAALKRWMVADPEQAMILTEFEEQYHSLDQTSQNPLRKRSGNR